MKHQPDQLIIRLTLLQDTTDLMTITVPFDVDPLIGRETATNDIALHDKKVSRIHARLVRREGEVAVQDFLSSLGTFVNGTKIETEKVLSDGDIVQLGDTSLRITLTPYAYEESEGRTADVQLRPSGVQPPVKPAYRYCPHCGERVE